MYTLPNILLLGVCICVALGANSLDAGGDTIKSYFREHNGRRLESVNAKRGEFPFFSHWGGCGATLVWEDVLLTSAGVSPAKNTILFSIILSHSVAPISHPLHSSSLV